MMQADRRTYGGVANISLARHTCHLTRHQTSHPQAGVLGLASPQTNY